MFNSINKKDWRLVVLSIVLSITSLSVCARDKLAFPLPNKLQADVRFWTKIYTEVTTSEGLIHDNKRLDIIYDRVTFKPGTSYKERQKIINLMEKINSELSKN